LAGSRFLRSTEIRYAPVEGEALAIAWSLRTLFWRFTIIHAPGKSNFFSDATSRNPVQDADQPEYWMALDSVRLFSED